MKTGGTLYPIELKKNKYQIINYLTTEKG